MESEWRTVQIFISEELNEKNALEVSEVSIHADGPSNIRCTCKDYQKLALCKHTNYVIRKMEKNNGSFGLMIPEDIPDELAYSAFSEADSSRDFVINYGKIEVM